MRINENLAEVVGVFIGDGCLSNFENHGRRKTCITFCGSWENDEIYYNKKIVCILNKEFNCSKKYHHSKKDNTLRYALHGKEIVNFFIDLGMPIGIKGNRIEIPKEILNDEKMTLACIRGIFNTDGSVYSRYSKKYNRHPNAYLNYAVVQFKMKNWKVIGQIKGILEKQGLRVNKITKVLNCQVIRITEQKSVKQFFDMVGFTHPYHERRYLDIVKEKSSH
jgi:DNA-binding transcriptional regulator WhiA